MEIIDFFKFRNGKCLCGQSLLYGFFSSGTKSGTHAIYVSSKASISSTHIKVPLRIDFGQNDRLDFSISVNIENGNLSFFIYNAEIDKVAHNIKRIINTLDDAAQDNIGQYIIGRCKMGCKYKTTEESPTLMFDFKNDKGYFIDSPIIESFLIPIDSTRYYDFNGGIDGMSIYLVGGANGHKYITKLKNDTVHSFEFDPEIIKERLKQITAFI